MSTFIITYVYDKEQRKYVYAVHRASDGHYYGHFYDNIQLQKWKELMTSADSKTTFLQQEDLFIVKFYDFFLKSHADGLNDFEDMVMATTPGEAIKILRKRWKWLSEHNDDVLLENLNERKK